MAEVNAEAESGAYFPMVYGFGFGTLGVATHTFEWKVDQPGRIRNGSFMAQFPNTVTVNLFKNGASIVVAAKSLTTGTLTRLKGFGDDATGAEQHWNTDTAANRAKFDYEAGDEFSLDVVVGTAAATAGNMQIVCDERQPVTIDLKAVSSP